MLNEWYSYVALFWFDFCDARDEPRVSHFKIKVTEKMVSGEMNRYGGRGGVKTEFGLKYYEDSMGSNLSWFCRLQALSAFQTKLHLYAGKSEGKVWL